MSQTPDSAFDHPAAPAKGMPVSALVCSIVGCCLPGLGLVGVVLGIVSLVRSKSDPRRFGGGGVALAAIIVGALSLAMSIVVIFMLGLLLPALGKARNTARSTVTISNARVVGMALHAYANDNKGWLPEPGADLGSRLGAYGVTPGTLESHSVDSQWRGATDTFIYVPGFRLDDIRDPAMAVVLYENPKYRSRGQIAVLYADGHVGSVRLEEIEAVIVRAEKPGATKPATRPGG